MRDITSQLIQIHREILLHLEKATRYGPGSENAKAEMRTVKKILQAHLAREDEDLYPILTQFAQADTATQDAMKHFSVRMAESTQLILAQFQQYETSTSGLEHAQTFGLLVATLKNRIAQEEEIFFPLYRKALARKVA